MEPRLCKLRRFKKSTSFFANHVDLRKAAFHFFSRSGMIRGMIDKKEKTRCFNWVQTPRSAKEGRWSKLYVSLNRQGTITLSGFTHGSMGSPDSYLLLYDEDLNVVGMQPARLNVTKNAFPAALIDKRGGRKIYAGRMMREHNLYMSETAWFPRCYIDHTGTLILELNDVRPVRRNGRPY
jgi:hypothetical protein